MKRYPIILIAVFISACTSVSTAHRPDDYYIESGRENSNEPLFNSEGGPLADSDIQRILNYRLAIPAKNRIAILKLSSDSHWRYYSNDFSLLTESMADNFIGQLRSSPRVYDASFLPSMLVPEKRTAPYLREAAARYQADLLLAYRSNCRTFEKYKLIDPNESKAYCSVEAVLLDVRSGIVPFTVVSSNEFTARKELGDMNFRETVKKAELSATSRSLEEAANSIVQFLASADTLR